ncbi:acyl-CoA dehydratase activase-related protein [Metallumcola ferriviriculae]|uniref:Acyl-CoA dehydratase activase-related protein n=1 Tax=Metallumcola ferriviriculae TaxID=3039180 RepID=A0AAU0UQ10_9FIRM|nr:acyl-CoA dehydratase activase-related protein [Desulfitibacteraceae bacterium MK1]
MKETIGYPTALSYYSYYPFWNAFFTTLGFSVVISPASSKQIIDWGVKETVNDACIPIKLFHGHVMSLKDRVDYLFVPRMVSVDGKTTFCPKFLGLPDMVRWSIPDLPRLIDERIDLKKGARGLLSTCYKIGNFLKQNPARVFYAYLVAQWVHRQYQDNLNRGIFPNKILPSKETGRGLNSIETEIRIAVLGYPYEIYDSYISVNLLQKLNEMGVAVRTVEMLSNKVLGGYRHRLSKNLFWQYSNRVLWATYHYLEKKIDGIIHVSAFGCGPDAMLDKLMQLEAKKHDIPFMTLTLDEHTGEAGVVTRLEAFVDMVRFRRESS